MLGRLADEFNANRAAEGHLPHLAALICCSPFDIAIHDAYGQLHDVPTYQTYNRQFMNCDLAEFLTARRRRER